MKYLKTPCVDEINNCDGMGRIVLILLKIFYSILRRGDLNYIHIMKDLILVMIDKYGVVVQLRY
jgi:hypothetical protein